MSDSDADVLISDSGGTMTRLTGVATARPVDLAVLRGQYNVESERSWTPAGQPPYLPVGSVVQWRYSAQCDPMRVVRDDERGLVAWLADDTELLASVPSDGISLRDKPLTERFDDDRVPAVTTWRSGGVLRIAPTDRPWSVWVFWEDDGSLAGHYINLELPHRRYGSETNTRDLTLDLWLEASGELLLKDADELEAGTAVGYYTEAEAAEIRAIAEWARAEVVEDRSWVLDEEWTTWEPQVDWTMPPLPDTPLVREARRRTLPS